MVLVLCSGHRLVNAPPPPPNSPAGIPFLAPCGARDKALGEGIMARVSAA